MLSKKSVPASSAHAPERASRSLFVLFTSALTQALEDCLGAHTAALRRLHDRQTALSAHIHGVMAELDMLLLTLVTHPRAHSPAEVGRLVLPRAAEALRRSCADLAGHLLEVAVAQRGVHRSEAYARQALYCTMIVLSSVAHEAPGAQQQHLRWVQGMRSCAGLGAAVKDVERMLLKHATGTTISSCTSVTGASDDIFVVDLLAPTRMVHALVRKHIHVTLHPTVIAATTAVNARYIEALRPPNALALLYHDMLTRAMTKNFGGLGPLPSRRLSSAYSSSVKTTLWQAHLYTVLMERVRPREVDTDRSTGRAERMVDLGPALAFLTTDPSFALTHYWLDGAEDADDEIEIGADVVWELDVDM
jgi:hypothetical protein